MGTTTSRVWSQKLSTGAFVRGSTLAFHPTNNRTYYACHGGIVYKSQNRGDTWSVIATIPGGVSRTNAFLVSPNDSLLMLAAVASPNRIVRSVDGGLNWTTTRTGLYGEYGVPLEMDASHPNEILFAPEDGKLYKSTDFGATWAILSTPGFRSPCDIQIVPDSNAVIWVGDGVTNDNFGKMFVSTDGGLNFAMAYQTSGSEIPMIACSRLDNNVGFATSWGSGGVRKTADFGGNWPLIAPTTQTWGVDIARDDPNVVMYAVYSGATSYISFNQGTTFSSTGFQGANYSLFLADRGTILAEQSSGIYKMIVTHTTTPDTNRSILVIAPNGNETWAAGSQRTLAWSSSNVAVARLEYRKKPGDPWQFIAAAAASQDCLAWTVPNEATTQARIRVSDAHNGALVDSSDTPFTILKPELEVVPDTLQLGVAALNTTVQATITLLNGGTAPLTVSDILSDGAQFTLSRTALVVPAGGSDTVTVFFTPLVTGPDTALVTVVSDEASSPDTVVAIGEGGQTSAAGEAAARPAAFVLQANQPNPFRGTTRIHYALPSKERVSLEVFDLSGRLVASLVQAEQGPGEFSADFGPGVATAGGVRVGPLASGVYFYRLRAGRFSRTFRMMLVR
jgi:photosystem II stability/assembly factor-like uncharacterized protein